MSKCTGTPTATKTTQVTTESASVGYSTTVIDGDDVVTTIVSTSCALGNMMCDTTTETSTLKGV